MVPRVVGLTVARARAVLAGSGLMLGTIRGESGQASNARVVRQDVLPGIELRDGQSVNITVRSSRPEEGDPSEARARRDSRQGSPVLGYRRYVEFNGHSGHPKPWAQDGWGDYAPVYIDYEGDGTASFSSVRWVDWGHPIAYGYGTSLIFRPQGGHVAVRGELRASQIGLCHGRRAYEHVDYRLFFRPGTNLYRHYGTTSGHWLTYGFPHDDGNVCLAARVLF